MMTRGRFASLKQISVLAFCCGLLLVLAGCLTPGKEKELRKDLFDLQTRLLTLEGRLAEKDKEIQTSGESANKRLASTSTEMDRLKADIQRLNGELDAIKVGVQSGQMPGPKYENQESVATKIQSLEERIAGVEQSQEEILTALEKSGLKKGKHTKADDKKAKTGEIKTLAELKAAYDKQRFKNVVEAAPKIIKATKGRDKEESAFMYAESLFRANQLRDSALEFNNYVDLKPASKERVRHAKLRMGDCFRQLGDQATAKLYYGELVSEFPDSVEAKKAKERLAELEGGKKKTSDQG